MSWFAGGYSQKKVVQLISTYIGDFLPTTEDSNGYRPPNSQNMNQPIKMGGWRPKRQGPGPGIGLSFSAHLSHGFGYSCTTLHFDTSAFHFIYSQFLVGQTIFTTP